MDHPLHSHPLSQYFFPCLYFTSVFVFDSSPLTLAAANARIRNKTTAFLFAISIDSGGNGRRMEWNGINNATIQFKCWWMEGPSLLRWCDVRYQCSGCGFICDYVSNGFGDDRRLDGLFVGSWSVRCLDENRLALRQRTSLLHRQLRGDLWNALIVLCCCFPLGSVVRLFHTNKTYNYNYVKN